MRTFVPSSSGLRAGRAPSGSRVAVIGSPTRASDLLVGAWQAAGLDAAVMSPQAALTTLEAGDVALFRLDVLPTLDGVEPGLEAIPVLEQRGVRMLNRREALLTAHDKLRTAAVLGAAGVRHPRTFHVTRGQRPASLPVPCVVKPRFGSWGADVILCRTQDDLERALDACSSRPWWAQHGALVQELVPPVGRDLRLLVAGGEVVGGAMRVAAPGEWRTNVSVGGHLEAAEPPPEAVAEAERAARAVAIDLAGVDLLPWDGAWVVLELNGAVDFDERYTLQGADLYGELARALGLGYCPARRSGARAPMPAARHATRSRSSVPASVGDRIEITGPLVGEVPRNAEILKVLSGTGSERFRVRWEDGHESIYTPGDDALIVHPGDDRTSSPS